ncbi:MAG: ABC transporter substrate binding protein, partial [Oscillospiraceae bacterium]
MKKKIFAALAAAAMLVSATACSSSNTSSTGNSGAADENKVYNVGICQLVEHPALDAATEGFKAALTEKLGENVKFDDQNAQGESTNCTTICTGFVASNVDRIFANATGALQA